MHVIQSQLVNYSYNNHTQKHLKLVRWWVLGRNEAGEEIALPFTDEEEKEFSRFMRDHPVNFPPEKKEVFESTNLVPPFMDDTDRSTDIEKPCLLLIRAQPLENKNGICRRMDIILEEDDKPFQLNFDLAGEIILEKA